MMTPLVIRLRHLRDTKNKILYVEDPSNPYRGKNIYLHQDEMPNPAPRKIKVTVEADE